MLVLQLLELLAWNRIISLISVIPHRNVVGLIVLVVEGSLLLGTSRRESIDFIQRRFLGSLTRS